MVDGSFVSTPVLNDARQVTPVAGTPMYTARQRPRETMPGRLVRWGSTPSGSVKIAVRPGAFGTIVIVNSVPAATCFSVNSLTAAGGSPGTGPVVLNTNGCG